MSEVKFEKYSITLSTEMKMPAIEIRNFSINVAEKSLATLSSNLCKFF